MAHSKSSPSTSAQVTEELEQEIQQLLASLPKEKALFASGILLYHGCWYPAILLRNVIVFQRHFQAQDHDIILAAMPRSGINWLKALVFSIVNRSNFTDYSTNPLLTTNLRELVPLFEIALYNKKDLPDLTSIQSPRLFSTHIPYECLPVSIKECKNIRIVYICRNPFDVMVSLWQFAQSTNRLERTMDDWVDSFCEGTEAFGPYWDHVLGYWKESLENPNKVLFLKFEDLKEDSNFQLKRLAEFIGFPFSEDEERGGVIEEVLKLCRLWNLKDLEVNKLPTFENKSSYKNREEGGWVNHLTPAMVERMEKIIREKLQGFGFTSEPSEELIDSSSSSCSSPYASSCVYEDQRVEAWLQFLQQ